MESERIEKQIVGDNSLNQKLGETAKDLEKNEQMREKVAFWSARYRMMEKDFTRLVVPRRETEAYEIYEKWEEFARISFGRMKDAEYEAGFSSKYECDKVENIGLLSPDDSIEAYAGHYYLRRQKALAEAIRASNDENKEEELKFSDDFFYRAGVHMYYRYDYDLKKHNLEQWKNENNRAHNSLIEHLNYMNDLARKYHVKPFTFRNFITNDDPTYKRSLDYGGYTDARCSYDRSSVEAYCRNAFPSSYEKALKDSGLEHH